MAWKGEESVGGMSLFWWASAAMVFCASVLYTLARLFHQRGRSVAVAMAGVVLGTGLAFGMRSQVSYWLTDVVVLLGGSVLGWLLGRSASNLESLLRFMIAGATADVISFYFGLTGAIMEAAARGSLWLQYLSFSLPHRGVVQPVVGVGDVVFLFVIYYALVRAPGLPAWVYFLPFLAMEVALVAGLLLNGVPALPFLAAAVYLIYRAAKKRRPAGLACSTQG